MRGVDLAQAERPALGSKLRPRRAWESILWFSRSPQPYCDLKACGKESDRLGFTGDIRFAENGFSEKTAWHPCVESFGNGNGIARISDVILAPIGTNEPGVDHPAVFPLALAEQLVKTFSQEGDLVLDPFCGSGQTLLAAKGCGRRYPGDRAGGEVRQDRPGAAAMMRSLAPSRAGGSPWDIISRLNFSFAPERIERLKATPEFQEIATSDKEPGKERDEEIRYGKSVQEDISSCSATWTGGGSTTTGTSSAGCSNPCSRG